MSTKKQQTINRFRQAVGETFIEKGVAHATITALARQAGYNTMLIYRYFGGHTALLEAYLQHHLHAIHQESVGLGDPATHWRGFIIHFYRELRTNPGFRLLIRWLCDHPRIDVAQRLNGLINQALNDLIPNDDLLQAGAHLLLGGIIHSVHITGLPESRASIQRHEELIAHVGLNRLNPKTS